MIVGFYISNQQETRGVPRLSLGNGDVQKKARTLHQGFGGGFMVWLFFLHARLGGGRTQGPWAHLNMFSRCADLALSAATPP